MRNPDRIGPMLKQLESYWRANPDLRLGQIISNMAASVGSKDCFFTEDDKMMGILTAENLKGNPEQPEVVEIMNINNLSETENKLMEIYQNNDVCMGEVLASTGVNNISLEDAMELYCKLMNKVEGDTFVQYYNCKPCMNEIYEDDYRIIGEDF